MNNPFFNAMTKNDPRRALESFRSNPVQALRNAGYNLPEGLNDPRQIIQHLMQSGQLSQTQVGNAQNIARRMGFRF